MRNYVVSTEFAALDRGFSSTMRNVSGSFDRVTDRSHRMSHAVRESSGLFSRFTAGAFAGNLLANSVQNLTGDMWNLSKEVFATQKSMEALLGPERATKAIDFLKTSANELGVAFLPAIAGYNKLALSGERLGFGEAKLNSFVKGFMTYSAAVQLTAGQQSRAFYAFEQMLSKTTVQAEELKVQLGDIPGIMPLFIQAIMNTYNVPRKRVADLMKEGAVDTQRVFAEVSRLWSTDFGDKATMMSNTFLAALNRVETKKAEIGAMASEKLFPSFAVGVESGLDIVSAGIPILDRYGGSMLKFAAAVIAVNTAMKIKRSLDLSFQGDHYSGIRRISEMTAEYRNLTRAHGYGATTMSKSAAAVKLFGGALASVGITAAVYGLTELGMAAYSVYDKMKLIQLGARDTAIEFGFWETSVIELTQGFYALTGQWGKWTKLQEAQESAERGKIIRGYMRDERVKTESVKMSPEEERAYKRASEEWDFSRGMPRRRESDTNKSPVEILEMGNSVRVDLNLRVPPGVEVGVDKATGETPVKVRAVQDNDLGKPNTQRYR